MVTESAFSPLPGIDRTLVALAGGGIALDVDGQSVTLDQFEIARFSGDSVVTGGPRGDATRDLNLMVRRPRSATLQLIPGPARHTLTPQPGHEILVIVAQGAAEIGVGDSIIAKAHPVESGSSLGWHELGLADAALVDMSMVARIHGSSKLIVISICDK